MKIFITKGNMYATNVSFVRYLMHEWLGGTYCMCDKWNVMVKELCEKHNVQCEPIIHAVTDESGFILTIPEHQQTLHDIIFGEYVK